MTEKNRYPQHAGHPYYLSRKDWKIGISIEPDEKTEIQDTWFGTIEGGRTGINKETGEWTPSPRPKTTGFVVMLGSRLNHIPTIKLYPTYLIKNKTLTKTHIWKQEFESTQCWKLTGILEFGS